MAVPKHLLAPGGAVRRLARFVSVALIAMAEPASADDRNPEQDVVVRNVRLIDFVGNEVRTREGHSVLIRDGRIVGVAPADQLAAPAGSEIIEGRCRTLVPGLTDMHVHIWDEAELGAYLASGVTTVRNMSGMPHTLEMRNRVANGELSGPRIITTGPILNSPGPNAQLNHQIVETAEEGRRAVRAQHAQGYGRIKVYSNLKREAYDAIRAEAHLLAMPITGHTPEGERTEGIPARKPFEIEFSELLDDDWETIEHVESIAWHGLRDRQDRVLGEALAREIAEAGIAVDPTLIAFANLVRTAETRGAHLQREGSETLNPFVRSMETAQSERWTHEDFPRAQAQLGFYLDFTKMLSKEGVLLVAGSDAGIATNIPGVSLHDEFDLLIAAGLTPFEVLQAATVNAAQVLGQDNELGRIDPGQRADLLLIDGNPLDRIELLRRPDMVIVGGRVYGSDKIQALWHSATLTNAERTARNVLLAMEAQGTEVDLGN